MRRRVGENAGWIALILAGLAGMAWLGLAEFGWNDYDNEARPAIEALVQGHLTSFFQLAPVYGGSLLERAPFALLTDLLGGGEVAIYRMMAVPCMIVGGLFALWLGARMRRDGHGLVARLTAVTLCVVNPLTLLALEIGHPEELLGIVLCVVAVLLAARDRGVWAGIALGLAIANKQWAVLAIGPVLVALPSKRVLCLTIAGSLSASLLVPFALIAPNAFLTGMHSAASSYGPSGTPGVTFQPWQIWWFFGSVAHHIPHALLGTVKVGARVSPAWVQSYSHPLIVALLVPATIPLLLRRRNLADALGLLALLLLERCMLDPWDNIYYPLPFVLALLCWEVIARRRAPVLALATTLTLWATHGLLETVAGPDVQSIVFDAWTVPLALWLAATLYVPTAISRLLNFFGTHTAVEPNLSPVVLDASPT